MTQKRDAAIVGIHEYPSRDVEGQVSALQIKAESAARALDDAGLSWSDVDALYDAGEGGGLGGLNMAEYFGLKPNVIDTTNVGGSSYEYHAAHAKRDITAGKARVALLTYGSTAHSRVQAIGVGGGGFGGAHPADNMDVFAGATLVANYAMVAQRHMHQFGTTSEQLAEISVATRCHAMRNPEAVQAMHDLEFLDIRETTVADVAGSRMIADPLHLLECCMISDGGGAVVIAAPEVARDCTKIPVWLLGTGEATAYPENGRDITVSAAAQSAPGAFDEAGVSPDEMDIAMIYDSFSITVLTILEDLGFCAKGEGGSWVEGGRLRFDRPDAGPALNTDGGGLSSNHPGMRGIFLLIEAARQLRGESCSQVADAKLAVAHGNGGMLGSRHCAGTIVMGRD
ncbi:MAG: thiolase domain-containing protein [Pseudomonadales bacterium]|jgi:acetyl-CoA C-acetyltransferase|nr:thiolase domain-containing protein [Pseudomonadales bacterium]MDP6472341.1 thiolase domain-containing protein [Pseudomonadales bacterium]MDP6828137.1 thiolase domain-containing protein [Pseudomonadales bacterium]|tara:strand:- start:2122 stop:3315 length:1194 start_codon:yes stop_codon:yes gene_type:complete